MKACFNWPNNSDYLQPERIASWFNECRKRGLPTSLPWWAQSAFRRDELVKVLAANPDYLFILVNPDGSKDAAGIPLQPYIQCKSDEFWATTKYPEYNAVLKAYKGKIVVVYDMEGYSKTAKEATKSTIPASYKMIESRMFAWEYFVEDILCKDLQIEDSFWYGAGWSVPHVNTQGQCTVYHIFDRVNMRPNCTYVNMYWQVLASLKYFSYSHATMLFQWCGGLKDFTTGHDRAALDKESQTFMPQTAHLTPDVPYVCFYGEEWPRFVADRTLFLDNYVGAID